MMEVKKAEVVVLGGGPGGYTAAIRAGALGKKVLVIERDRVGGTCLNRGCIPTKALLSATEILEEMERMSNVGIHFDGMRLDVQELHRFKQKTVDKLVKGVEYLFKGNGVEKLGGSGKFVAPKRLQVETPGGIVEVEGENVIIATGSEVAPLPSLPTDGKSILNSDQILEMTEVPKSLLVIGAGPVGLEFAVIFHRLGSAITVVEMMPQVLPGCDRDLASALHRSLKKRKMEIFLSTMVQSYAVTEGGIKVQIAKVGEDFKPIEGTEETLQVEKILVATGRRPTTRNIGLDRAGVEVSPKGFIPVKPNRETNVPGVYAIGDITGPPLLAHKAMKEGIVAAEAIAGLPSIFDVRSIPGVVYTEPEVAWAGLTEEEAHQQGYEVAIGTFPFAASGRALSMNKTEGMVKLIGEAKTDRLLGIHIIGPGASEFMGEASLALEMGATVRDIGFAIHPHPTLSEAIMEAAERLHKKAIHILNQ